MKLKKNDEVEIVSGKDKGKRGKVEKLFPKEDTVIVGGMNQYKRHIKGKMQGQKSEIVTITKPLHSASVIIVCPKCHKKTRVGYMTKNGKKIRICKKCEQAV